MNSTRPVSRPVLFQACGTLRGKNAQVPGLPTVTSSPILKVISPASTQATSSLSRCIWKRLFSSWPPSRSRPRDQMLVARLPGDHDRRALADRVRLCARDTDAYALTSGVADDEDAVAVIDDHANLDRQAVRKQLAVADQLKTLGTHEHVDGRARE